MGLSCLSHHDSWIPAAFGHRLQLGDQLILSGSMLAVASVTAFAPVSVEDGQNETKVCEPIMTMLQLTERWFYWGMDWPDPTGLGMVAAAWLRARRSVPDIGAGLTNASALFCLAI